jgi:cell division protein FtsL
MKTEELFEDIDTSEDITQRYFGLSIEKFLVFFIIILIIGVYIGILLYGTNSLEVLLELQDYEYYLQSDVSRLKSENAALQKEYFELKEISAR